MPRFPLAMLLVFALTLFSSATLLFMVEPMIGKMILPLLGGTPAVWNTCMVFFQAVLLLGYAYAHASTSWLGSRKQASLHLLMLSLPFVLLPVAVNRDLIKGDENPVLLVLIILSLSVGLPMFVVSASAPLLQKWFASTSHPAASDPYFLYGASNLGSMLSLIAYPTVVEPYLRLGQQSFDWTIGYAVLVALTAVCAVFLWQSPPSVTMFTHEKKRTDAESGLHAESIQTATARHGVRQRKRSETNAFEDTPLDHTLTGDVTWMRVLRWVALAFVPSSLMLGATTYITTDIAAISYLWVAPLALYLLSFILVFSRIPSWVHSAMIIMLPLLVLALLFFILAEVKHWIGWSLALHLTTMFVVSMVCHGELARDRPPARFLTGYFLWMSVGGVLGGLFNSLLAPVIFTGIVEYELAMLLACYLTPPLSETEDNSWGRRADVTLACLFAAVGALLLLFRKRDDNLPINTMENPGWPWQLAMLLGGLAIGVTVAVRARDKKFDRWMDVILPLSLGFLLIGLSWGLRSEIVWTRLEKLAGVIHRSTYSISRILTYGVPLVLSYTFVERSLRFALGIGAILLASGFCGVFDNKVLHQERSFYGVLKIEKESFSYDEQEFDFLRLVHGTTLHGMQMLDPERNDEPLTYYHRTGPVGEIMMQYNGPDVPPERMNLGVIGLGTGTMACYARPGQHITFYDIDPIIRRYSFDEGKPYFTFVHNARERKAKLALVMGDARLTMEKQRLNEAEKYGVIIVDAFSSDAIPIHLITREAIDVYLDKMTERGLLCFHVSNRYLDLKPVLYNLARDRSLAAVFQSDDADKDRNTTAYIGKSTSTWVVLARKSEYLDKLRALNDWEDRRKELRFQFLPLSLWPDYGSGLSASAMMWRNFLGETICQRPSTWDELEPTSKWPDLEKVGTWTDDYSNLFSVFWW